MSLAVKILVPIAIALITQIAAYFINQLTEIKNFPGKLGLLVRLTIWLTLGTVALEVIFATEGVTEKTRDIFQLVGAAMLMGLVLEGWTLVSVMLGWRAESNRPEPPLDLRERLVQEHHRVVKQRLDYAVGDLALINLVMEPQPEWVGGQRRQGAVTLERVAMPKQRWNVFRLLQGKKAQDIAPKETILETFDDEVMGGRLLILGQPGLGKTTTLLKLADALLERAKTTQQIPYIFELSAWRDDDQKISDWLIGQLKFDHGIDPKASRKWLTAGRMILLLDGLDELGPRQQQCADRINEFVRGMPGQQVVVCCRVREYEEGNVLLTSLNGALCLQPLDNQQVQQYLHGLQRSDIWDLLQRETGLHALLEPPINPAKQQLLEAKRKSRQEFIKLERKCLKYNEQINRRRREWSLLLRQAELRDKDFLTNPEIVAVSKTIQELDSSNAWGIEELNKLKENQKYLERDVDRIIDTLNEEEQDSPLLRIPLFLGMIAAVHQPETTIVNKRDLLKNYISQRLDPAVRKRFQHVPRVAGESRNWAYRTIAEEPNSELTQHYLIWLASRLNKKSVLNNFLIEGIQPDWLYSQLDKALYKLIFFAINSAFFGILMTTAIVFQGSGLSNLWMGLIAGLVMGATSLFLISDFPGSYKDVRTTIEFFPLSLRSVVEGTKHIWTSWRKILIFGSCASVCVSLVCEFFLRIGIPLGSIFSLGLSLIWSLLAITALFSLAIIASVMPIQVSFRDKNVPNQVIFATAFGSVVAMTLTLPLWTLFSYVFSSLNDTFRNEEHNLSYNLFMGLALAIVPIYFFGLLPVLQHFSLRCVLYFRGYAPWNYAKFLKYTTERRLTQQIGGRFRFIHRELLDHFAAMDTGAPHMP